MKAKFLFLAIGLSIMGNSYGVSTSRPLGNESRIRVVNYVPNSVIRFVGHYNFHSIIEFGQDEEIKTITMGETSGWQLNPAGNRIFLKPIGDDAVTNMTVITNKRTYFFEMHAEYASSISDSSLAFITKFMYPDGQLGIPNNVGNGSVSGMDLGKPSSYNFRYKISGKASHIEPLLVFDDGKFTYFKFRDVNADIPSIFLVDANQNESLINYRVVDGYIVVERVTNKFTLRSGKDVICVFNEKQEITVPLPKLSELNKQVPVIQPTLQPAAVITQPGIEIIQPK
jgi:type IV secretion system protein VirB9